jgi:predicted MFS family arabinose efflux permease
VAPDRPDAREPVRELRRRPHYAWLVVAAAFAALLIASGIRATPTILIEPLDEEFGWRVDQVSLAISLNLVLFGLMAPFSAALMERFGMRRVVTVALAAMAAGSAVTIAMSALWQLTLLWGVVIGAATGCLSSPLAAIVATRWFVERRGLVTGLLSAAYATGQLIFLPFLALLVRDAGWRWASAAVALSAAAVAPLAYALLRERPADRGLPPYGGTAVEPPPAAGGNPFAATAAALALGARSRAFWLLAGTFFICGATTVGLIATHLIPAAHDHGIGEVQAAGLLAVIGVFDIIGVTASGWLTDRWDARQLLFAFYALRGLSLFFLPFVIGSSDAGLIAFVVVFGLDWVATVPPTVALTVAEFGRERAGVVFGWIFAAHQLGAAAAAWAAGAVRNASESYEVAFMGAGLLGVAAAFLALGIASRGRPRPAAAMPM